MFEAISCRRQLIGWCWACNWDRLRFLKSNSFRQVSISDNAGIRPNFRHIERKEWWLWAVAFVITLALMAGLLSFFPADVRIRQDDYSLTSLPYVVWGLDNRT
jgi:hypothetical protein